MYVLRKTQIAIELCYRHLKTSADGKVFWMHAGTGSKIVRSCRSIAEKLELPGWNDPQVDIIRVLHGWLADDQHGRWLLIVDGVDDLSIIKEPLPSASGPKTLLQFLPRRTIGHVLITTRDRRVGERLAVRAHTITVPTMTQEEGRLLLGNYSNTTFYDNLDKVDQLMQALDYLPLAITQAAAYMSENCISLHDYISLLGSGDEEMQDLLEENLSDGRREDPDSNSVIKTWKLSFDQIGKQDPRAADILSLMAMYDRQGVQTELFKKEKEPIRTLTSSLATLQNFSLISRTTDGGAYRMHRLVQLAVQAWLKLQGTMIIWQKVALDTLADIFPSGDYETRSLCEAYLFHARTILQNEAVSMESQIKRAELLKRIAWFDRRQHRYQVARAEAEEAAGIFNRIRGPEDPMALSCAVTVADCMSSLWQLHDADQILQSTTIVMQRMYHSAFLWLTGLTRTIGCGLKKLSES